MDRERLDNWLERGILLLVLAILIFGPLTAGAFEIPDQIVLRCLTLAVVVLWLGRLAVFPSKRLLFPPVCWVVLGFLFYAIFVYQRAPIEFVARQELLKIIVYALLFFAVLNNLNGQDSSQKILMTLLIAGGLLGIYALLQFLTGSQKVLFAEKLPIYEKRATGTFFNPNILGGYLEMILPFGITFLLVGRFKHITKIIIGYFSLFIFVGIAVSFSRGAWLATVIALAVLFIILLSKRNYRLPTLVMVLIFAGFSIFFFKQEDQSKRRLKTLINAKSEDVRFDLWKPAWQMWNEQRLWGVGPGHFDHRFPAYRPVHIAAKPLYVHNDYLNTLCDWGIAGFTLVLAGFFSFYVLLFNLLPHVQKSDGNLGRRTSNKYAIVLGGAASVMAIALHSFVDFNLQLPSHAILLAVIIALVSSYSRFATEKFWIRPAWWVQSLLVLALTAASGFLLLESWKSGTQLKKFAEAKREKISFKTRIQLLEKAQKIDPKNPPVTHYLAETLLLQSFEGYTDYQLHGKMAVSAFQRAIANNPFDPIAHARLGMAMDWIETGPKTEDRSLPFYTRAFELDRYNYLTAAYLSWHFMELERYPEARFWCQTSLHLENSKRNSLAHLYWPIINENIQEEVRRLNRGQTAIP